MARVHAPKHVRFWNRVSGGDYTECWLWQGFIANNGYGYFSPALGERWAAHRYAYTNMRADIPEGLQIDHLCRVRACVNPWHLEPVDADTNLKRVPTNQANRTHCPDGHEYDAVNTYISKAGKRHCRPCHAARQREYTRRKRMQAA